MTESLELLALSHFPDLPLPSDQSYPRITVRVIRTSEAQKSPENVLILIKYSTTCIKCKYIVLITDTIIMMIIIFTKFCRDYSSCRDRT